ncbi:MAG: prolipoprotein diacylglyceryl transferase [Cyclobacteriaceae bacterium]|nr:prolipoprotein diacylglyceryl transferase [Cyclobacteriaceae bacterium]
MFTFIEWNPSPVIIDFGFYEVRWYSLLFALGFVLSYMILKGQFKKAALHENLLDKLTVYIVVATVLGARLAHCLFYDWEYYSQHLLEILLPFRFNPEFRFTGFMGLASHGGIFAIVIAVLLFARSYKVNAWWIFDKLSIVGALAGACIRLGNLMNSEIVGKPTDVSWAFIFVPVDNLPRHPGQLYEALAYLFIFVLLFLLDRHNARKPGFIFGIFFVLLFTARFLIEFVKADQADFEAGMVLNMGQLLSIPFILAGFYIAYRNSQPVNEIS